MKKRKWINRIKTSLIIRICLPGMISGLEAADFVRGALDKDLHPQILKLCREEPDYLEPLLCIDYRLLYNSIGNLILFKNFQ